MTVEKDCIDRVTHFHFLNATASFSNDLSLGASKLRAEKAAGIHFHGSSETDFRIVPILPLLAPIIARTTAILVCYA